jgi:hypothetical protein
VARGSGVVRDSVMNGRLRRLDRWCADRATQLSEVKKACSSDVGPDGGPGSCGGNAEDPAKYRGSQHRRDQTADRQLTRARPKTRLGNARGGRHRRWKHGMQRTGLAAPKRLGAGCNCILRRATSRAASERNQLLARAEPVAREWHYVVGGPGLFAAVLGFSAFRLHPVAAPLYRICRCFPPSRGGSVLLGR